MTNNVILNGIGKAKIFSPIAMTRPDHKLPAQTTKPGVNAQ